MCPLSEEKSLVLPFLLPLLPLLYIFLMTGSDVTELLSGVRSTAKGKTAEAAPPPPSAAAAVEPELGAEDTDVLGRVRLCSLSAISFFTACGLAAPVEQKEIKYQSTDYLLRKLTELGVR
jgi:hypothetical protein